MGGLLANGGKARVAPHDGLDVVFVANGGVVVLDGRDGGLKALLPRFDVPR